MGVEKNKLIDAEDIWMEGGIALAVVFAIAVIYMETVATAWEGGETSAPVALYWALLVVGVVAAIAGFVLGR